MVETIEVARRGQAGQAGTLFNLLNFILGAGALAVPQAFSLSGVALGTILTMGLGAMCAGTAMLLVSFAKADKVTSYKEFAYVSFGMAGVITVDFCIIVFLFGCMTGFLVVIADFLTPFYVHIVLDDHDSFGDSDDTEYRAVVATIVEVVVLIPLCLFPRIDFLKYTSTFAVFCILYMMIVVFVAGFTQQSYDIQAASWARGSFEMLAGLPVIVFSYAFHMTLFPIQNEMANPEKFGKMIVLACILSGLCYTFVGVAGSLTFDQCIENNILLDYENTVMVIIAKWALILVLCFSYPLMQFPCRMSLRHVFYPDNDEPSCWDLCPRSVRRWKGRDELGDESALLISKSTIQRDESDYLEKFEKDEEKDDSESEPSTSCVDLLDGMPVIPYVVTTLVLCFLSLILSLAVPNIQSIFGIIGATCGSLVIFILPGLAAVVRRTSW
eukprot:CAMPEP_0201487734 /NCGR_PEP_ID=MMETSP0151_2-20130828/15197_1 /ASSEMBLY_ACC=CAM_ASM_000257 /TAXON_ID=200890 /ORGANISM="Paramoeba atlantica, Strain 621/1 / CCAP 1560/9" /LENGTH=440 /DNA_ID=CAMNT_0047872873 /DNA_START=65 /DNA_END=1384 /DNA_ORIENTATION=-